MRFARWVFIIAGVYGLAVLAPQFFIEDQVGRDFPPAIMHPEFFYGFLGVACAWQVAFLIIASDPLRYRAIILPAVLEKLSFAIASALLFFGGRLSVMVFSFGMVDLAFGLLFIAAFLRTR